MGTYDHQASNVVAADSTMDRMWHATSKSPTERAWSSTMGTYNHQASNVVAADSTVDLMWHVTSKVDVGPQWGRMVTK